MRTPARQIYIGPPRWDDGTSDGQRRTWARGTDHPSIQLNQLEAIANIIRSDPLINFANNLAKWHILVIDQL